MHFFTLLTHLFPLTPSSRQAPSIPASKHINMTNNNNTNMIITMIFLALPFLIAFVGEMYDAQVTHRGLAFSTGIIKNLDLALFLFIGSVGVMVVFVMYFLLCGVEAVLFGGNERYGEGM